MATHESSASSNNKKNLSKTSCCAFGCTNSYRNTSEEVKFYRLPSENREPARRQAWINALKRINPDGSQWIPGKHARICSIHFIGGKTSRELTNPSYAPKLLLTPSPPKQNYRLNTMPPGRQSSKRRHRTLTGRVERLRRRNLTYIYRRFDNKYQEYNRNFTKNHQANEDSMQIQQDYENRMTSPECKINSISTVQLDTKNNHCNSSCLPFKRKIFDTKDMQLLKKHKASDKTKNFTNNFSSIAKYEIRGDIITTIRSILAKSGFQEKLQDSLKEMTENMDYLAEKSLKVDNMYNEIEENMKTMKNDLQYSLPKNIEIVDNNPLFTGPLPLKRNTSEALQQARTRFALQLIRGNTSDSLQQARARFSFQLTKSDLTTTSVIPNHQLIVSKSVKNGKILPSIEVKKSVDIMDQNILPILGIGPITNQDLVVGMKVFAMRANYLSVWHRAKITGIKVNGIGKKYYKIKFEGGRANSKRMYIAKHMASCQAPDVLLPVGSRIVAHYRDESWSPRSSLYAGVIAEPPKPMNNFRYLVFFDDGYAQYVKINEVYLVCESRYEVWEDIHPDSKEFIKTYLQQYPERPMVKLLIGQIIRTEWNGSWWIARVVEVDASLVKMFFHADQRTEWIYRGSTRLAPLYEELAAAQANRLSGKNRRHNIVTKKKHQPYVEYTRGLEEIISTIPQETTVSKVLDSPGYTVLVSTATDADESQLDRPQVAKKHTGAASLSEFELKQARNVARKSTTQLPQESVTEEQYNLISHTQFGQRENRKLQFPRLDAYVLHECDTKCLIEENLEQYKYENPLWIPLVLGWQRLVMKYRACNRRVIFYRGPCGRRLRSMADVSHYLLATKSKLTVDHFSFDSLLNTATEFVATKINCQMTDITNGKESIPVSCVNSINKEYPPYVEYSSTRFAAKGVDLNLDSEFLCGCDCDDNCQNREKCQCQQLTVEATKALPVGKIPNAGYYYKRLKEPLVTGVYECNSRCKCNSSCVNRVVQAGLKVRLQVFKTERRGWGIRCLNDLPQGKFICIYAGQLLTEQGANEDGNQYGDEYLAELDHIEVVERFKQGYESDVVEPEENKINAEAKTESDDDSVADSTETVVKKDYSSDSDFGIDSRVRIDQVDHVTRSKKKQFEVETDSNSSNTGKFTVPSSPADSSENVEHWVKSTSLSKSADEVTKRKFYNGAWITLRKHLKGEHEELNEDNNVELPDLDTEYSNSSKQDIDSSLFEDVNNIKLIRRPRVTRRTLRNDSTDRDKDSFSDSEEDNSKIEKNSTTSEADSEDTTKFNKVSLKSSLGTIPDMNLPIPRANQNSSETKHVSLRSYFNEEYCYIMDAKTCGNIGRYLNHSCCPNVFVQNVFVDTHDLRFPWVAFFAMKYIRAGTELTWDYNYDVGSVPGKVMYCYCGAAECRGRLL